MRGARRVHDGLGRRGEPASAGARVRRDRRDRAVRPEDRRGHGIPEAGIDGPTVIDAELWPSASNEPARGRLADVGRGVGQTLGRSCMKTLAAGLRWLTSSGP